MSSRSGEAGCELLYSVYLYHFTFTRAQAARRSDVLSVFYVVAVRADRRSEACGRPVGVQEIYR